MFTIFSLGFCFGASFVAGLIDGIDEIIEEERAESFKKMAKELREYLDKEDK